MRKHRKVHDDLQIICEAFLTKKHCAAGLSCKNRHSHNNAKKKEVCKHWVEKNKCKSDEKCEFLHEYDPSKMPICTFFRDHNFCNAGYECRFRHILTKEFKECRDYTKGFCAKGPKCRYKSGHITKTACPQYLAGFCPKGRLCESGHPKFDLISALHGEDNMGQTQAALLMTDCFICNKQGHQAADCPNKRDMNQGNCKFIRPLENVICHKCGSRGHYANHCPNPRAILPNDPNFEQKMKNRADRSFNMRS
jgi:cleavage and polyadenylation specificity factor subunit 4